MSTPAYELPPEAVSLLRRAIMLEGPDKVAYASGIDARTLQRALAGLPCSKLTYQRAVERAAHVLTSLDWRAFKATGAAP